MKEERGGVVKGIILRMTLDKRTGRGQKPVENLVLSKFVSEVITSILSVAGCLRVLYCYSILYFFYVLALLIHTNVLVNYILKHMILYLKMYIFLCFDSE